MPDEVIIYLMEEFGTPPTPIDEDVHDRVLSSSHGRQFAGWTRPQPPLAEPRDQYGRPSVSDEAETGHETGAGGEPDVGGDEPAHGFLPIAARGQEVLIGDVDRPSTASVSPRPVVT